MTGGGHQKTSTLPNAAVLLPYQDLQKEVIQPEIINIPTIQISK